MLLYQYFQCVSFESYIYFYLCSLEYITLKDYAGKVIEKKASMN